MKVLQVDLNKDYSHAIQEAVEVLNSGGVIIYPTDTLYGLGANVMNESAVKKTFQIKKRSLAKPMPLIIKNIVWAKGLAHINKRQEDMLEKIWPGKVTVVMAKKGIVPDIVTSGQKTVGMRVPDHLFVDQLLGKFGYPLTSTSANISGDEGTGDIYKIIETFSGEACRPDLIIDVGILPKSEPSTVLDLTGGKPKIIRVGPSRPDQLIRSLNI